MTIKKAIYSNLLVVMVTLSICTSHGYTNMSEKSGGNGINGQGYYLHTGVSINTECKNDGYMIGDSSGHFNPNNNITRAEFATLLSRIFVFDNYGNTSNKHFDDIDEHWAKSQINKLAGYGLFDDISSSYFLPNEDISRKEVIDTLSKIIDSKDLLNSGIYTILPDSFDVNDSITRGEVTHIINNILYKDDNLRSKYTEYFIRKNKILSDILTVETIYRDDCLIAVDVSSLL